MKFYPIISHLYLDDDGWHIQTNDEHSKGTAEIAAAFASEFGMAEWGRMLGLLHDRGKETEGFQAHIRKTSGYDSSAYSKESSHHSFIGAVLAHTISVKDQLFWLSNPIAGHHGGLYDLDELEKMLSERSLPPNVSKIIPDISMPLPKQKLLPRDSAHICRMLFSCLVDADWLDTERFMNKDISGRRGGGPTMNELIVKMEAHRHKLRSLPSSPMNVIRNEIQQICEDAAAYVPGFFDLAVPTGGGKTIASVIWALSHAVRYNKKRIIIAIPYTSIIVQTARVLKDIFGEDNVIEHHSVMNMDDADSPAMLACENWDAPIVVTTNVQLFESMFSNRRSTCRKLHSLCNSIVILDEIQTLPLDFLQPIVDAMQTYVKLFGTSFLFSTATQPILHGNHKGSSGAVFCGIEKERICSIIAPSMGLHEKLRRVRFLLLDTPFDYQQLAELVSSHGRVLCVVNSRRHALELFNAMPADGVPTFHLSRSMCSAHILDTIKEIKDILGAGADVRVISTQIVESGVDIDFPVVYRQMAGLDSILQAAGRCNREGKMAIGETFVFSFRKDNSIGHIGFAAETMRSVVALFPAADWFSAEFIQLYYEKLYARTASFDKEDISGLLNDPLVCRFEEASQKFRLIADEGRNIIVNFGNADELIDRIKRFGPSRTLVRELGRLSVNVPEYLYKIYVKSGLVEEPVPGIIYIPLQSQYDGKIGLKTTNDYIENNFII